MSENKRSAFVAEAEKLLARHAANTNQDKVTAIKIREDATSLAKAALARPESQIENMRKVSFVPQQRGVSQQEAIEGGMKMLGVRLDNLLYEIKLEASPELQRPATITVHWLMNHLSLRQWGTIIAFSLLILYVGILLGDTVWGSWIKQHASLLNLLK